MSLIASLPDIEKKPASVFVMHEKSEKLIPSHVHSKGQLSYVEGGIAYITAEERTYVVPARHYFWIPAGLEHTLRIGLFATVLRSLYFYTHNDHESPFYRQLGIYPASELLIQMINYTERWDGRHVTTQDNNFEFLIALKKLLPELNNEALPIALPVTDDETMSKITRYLDRHKSETLSLAGVSKKFNMSERSLSRLFQTKLKISFLQYLKTLRMIKAIEMIIKTNKSIEEISYDTGYKNLGSFSNAFFEFTHARPTDFRKR